MHPDMEDEEEFNDEDEAALESASEENEAEEFAQALSGHSPMMSKTKAHLKDWHVSILQFFSQRSLIICESDE